MDAMRATPYSVAGRIDVQRIAAMSDAAPRIATNVLRAFVAQVFRAAGSQPDEAAIVGDHLVDANLAGHDSHGVIRIPKYIDWHTRGMVLANRHVTVVRESPCHAVVDGGFGYGQVIAHEAMEIAVAKARTAGVCTLALRNAGHLGRIGAWAEQVAAHGFTSVHFVNTSGFGLLVAPHGGRDRRLSANPIAAGAARRDGPPLVLDMSTSAIAEGKIQVARTRGEQLPPGCTIDPEGRPNRDPAAFYGPPEGALLPVGGHKGYGLSVFCEIFAGALSGGQTTHPANATAGRLVNNMLSIVVDPDAFCGNEFFGGEIERFIEWVRASPPVEPTGEVLLPGDIERRTRVDRERDGIPLEPTTRRAIADCARSLGVTAPQEFVQ
jgi:hydroxycarboxylate dehydrogenase B